MRTLKLTAAAALALFALALLAAAHSGGNPRGANFNHPVASVVDFDKGGCVVLDDQTAKGQPVTENAQLRAGQQLKCAPGKSVTFKYLSGEKVVVKREADDRSPVPPLRRDGRILIVTLKGEDAYTLVNVPPDHSQSSTGGRVA